MKSETSAWEEIVKGLLKEGESIIDDNHLTTRDARRILDGGYKLLAKCEELRKSRDNWRNRFEELKTATIKDASLGVEE